MASTTTVTSSLPPGSLKSAFAKLDDDIFNSLAASQPGSPSLGATKISSDIPSPILNISQQQQLPNQQPQHKQQPTSAPNPTSSSTGNPKQQSPVITLLTTPNMTASSIAPLITTDAMLLCPHWNIPEPQTRSRRHSSAAHTGASAIAQTLSEMRQHRPGLAFEVETCFGDSAARDIAVFGQVQWQSEHLGRRVRLPFAVWAKVDGSGKVEFMQIVGE